jgi:dihydrofolate reductase
MSIIGIVAIAENFAIGKDGKLPWHYPADLKFFKQTTSGNVVVMGANTWRSIGKPLPNRLNIVLSRSGNVETPPSVMKLSTKGEVIELARSLNRDVYIIGGAKTYKDLADVIDEWIVTFIPLTIDDADTFMSADFLADFSELESIALDNQLIVKKYSRNS